MSTRLLSIITALVLSISSGAMAQGAADPVAGQAASPTAAASAVGHWLHDPQGNTIGSVRGLTDGGRTAVVMVGSYFRPGSYEARIPASALSIVDGKVTLRTETVQALAAQARFRG